MLRRWAAAINPGKFDWLNSQQYQKQPVDESIKAKAYCC